MFSFSSMHGKSAAHDIHIATDFCAFIFASSSKLSLDLLLPIAYAIDIYKCDSLIYLVEKLAARRNAVTFLFRSIGNPVIAGSSFLSSLDDWCCIEQNKFIYLLFQFL